MVLIYSQSDPKNQFWKKWRKNRFWRHDVIKWRHNVKSFTDLERASRGLQFDILLDMVCQEKKIDLDQGQIRPLPIFKVIDLSEVGYSSSFWTWSMLAYGINRMSLSLIFPELWHFGEFGEFGDITLDHGRISTKIGESREEAGTHNWWWVGDNNMKTLSCRLRTDKQTDKQTNRQTDTDRNATDQHTCRNRRFRQVTNTQTNGDRNATHQCYQAT